MAKEARVNQLKNDLNNLDYNSALRALKWMIETMNASNNYTRHDGSHYYYHLVDTAQDLLNHGIRNEAIITACILHDSIEDIKDVDYYTIEDQFGKDVAHLVLSVTKQEDIDYKEEENLKDYLDNILLSLGACLIKAADRKHNFSTLNDSNKKHEMKQVKETEEFYIPFFKQARKKYPEYSAYFHSVKTSIMPHLLRIKKAYEDEAKLKEKIKELEHRLDQERMKRKALEKKVKRGE
ncbi:HD domain-containing protein [Bacillus glycinifermentans]|uniref:HD domain-containing protein n=1 Tax=Bacillus TaxID=1386 RepID=UPI00158333A6|nr:MULTISPECIES: HD domain-containing protein [Bacillus]NUJ17470.1 HD domain-containing protein [Bacillus glycinifermentans]GIN67048.1 hypothetical protein J41TS2_24690 [Bacillus sonorensis]